MRTSIRRLCVLTLCLLTFACSRGGSGSKAAVHDLKNEPILEGKGVKNLVLGQTTPAEVAAQLGEAAGPPSSIGSAGAMEMRTPLFKLAFVPSEEDRTQVRLYAATTTLRKGGFWGKTSKGVGLLDSEDAMKTAYGPPQAEWIQSNQRLQYYEEGVIFTTQHPKGGALPVSAADYAEVCQQLDKQPSEAPDSRVITSIMVVQPFKVRERGKPVRAGQQVFSGPPVTDLAISAF